MSRPRKFVTCDCETDPFLKHRVPEPFIWGLYDGRNFQTFTSTTDFVNAIVTKEIIVYAHNGGKFDFMFLLPYIEEAYPQIIGGRIVSLQLGKAELRCSYAAVPEALDEIQKDKIEYWKMHKLARAENMPEILSYLKSDCVYLYDLMDRYRANAGTRKTIASNALAYSKKLGIDPGKTSKAFDRNYREFFFGGRCQCFQPGTHKGIQLLDIHSAYPFAMMHDHCTGSEFQRVGSLSGLSEAQIARSFIIIECTSRGAFPIRTKQGLEFPHEYNQFSITGWEYLVAKEFGLISDEKILSVRHTEKTINFSPYVNYWFEYKSRHPKNIFPIEYTIGKIMMNSLYGKLAQNPERYYDYKITRGGSRVDRENGWSLYTEYAAHEIHRRESVWKHKYFRDANGSLVSNGHEWEAKRIYNNVATGASITGFTRAHLLRALCSVGMENAIYCDTDGIALAGRADISRLPQSERIGDWGFEGIGETAHFAGKKLYGIRGSNEIGKPFIKIASKGSRLDHKLIEKTIQGETITLVETGDLELAFQRITDIIEGGTFEWTNDAPSFAIDGTAKFVTREIRATARGFIPEPLTI